MIAAITVGAVAVFAIVVGSRDRNDHSTRSTASQGAGAATVVEQLSVDEFATLLADPNVVVINVHTPYEGEIEGTDLFVPHERIRTDPRLPNRRDTSIALYCRSGSMSREAAEALRADGYTNVVELRGGMEAWQAAGNPILFLGGGPV